MTSLVFGLNPYENKTKLEYNTNSPYDQQVFKGSITSYIDHDPITITDKSGFETYSSQGDGNPETPYVINNLRIINTSTPCISVTGVEGIYFSIQDCFLSGNDTTGTGIMIDLTNNSDVTLYNNTLSDFYSGVYLKSSSQITIVDCIFESNRFGIKTDQTHSIEIRSTEFRYCQEGMQLYATSNSKIEDCYIRDNFIGIYLSQSPSIFLQQNLIANNSAHGISCLGGSYNITYASNHFYNNHLNHNTENTTIRDNTFEKGGVILPTLTVAQFNNVTLSNNSINGLPLYFSTGEVDSVINSGFGQVIIVDGYNLTIQSQNYSYTAIGISIHHSQQITIKENLCQNNTLYGINLHDVSSVELTKNICKFNKRDGIKISTGDYLLITRNNCTQNEFKGMDLASIENTIVSENILRMNDQGGMAVFYPKSSQIMKNDVGENFDHGIEISAESLIDDSITVAYNDIYNNLQSGIFLDSLTKVDVMYNQIRNNGYLGIQVRGTTELHAHHNAFLNNEYSSYYPSQALVYEDSMVINPQIYWYDIITGEGNYWSDLNNLSYYWIPGDDPHYDPNPLQQNPFETIIQCPPDAPRDLIAMLNGLTVQLTWEKPLEDGGAPIEYYNIYRGRNTEEYSYLGITRTTTFLDEQGTPGETYYYMVAAVNSIGQGEYSEVVMQNYPENPVTTTQSITSSHESTEDSTNASPGFIFPVILLTCALSVLLRRRK